MRKPVDVKSFLLVKLKTVATEQYRIPPWIHKTALPLFLLIVCPPAMFVFWYTNTVLEGSFLSFWHLVAQKGLFSTLWMICKPVFWGSPLAWKIIASFAASQLMLMRIVPGPDFLGPITPKGNVPRYKANGFLCFLITIGAFCLGGFVFKLFNPAMIYDELGPILGALNLFSLFFCLFLTLKGIFGPSSTDAGSSGNFIFDYYWGTELYPRVLGWDIKQFTNCRFGMMGWPLLLLCYGAKQHELYGLSDAMCVSIAIQLLYVGKFFLWETGYLRSLDIMHDRAGFMICWGCLVWVPCVYTSPTMYLVHHPNHLGFFVSSAILVVGGASVLINYFADRQRQEVRAKNGKCLVWRKAPHLISAHYKTQDGQRKQTLLLASGWWGLSRHFHYIPEIIASFFWALPALFTNFIPYFYTIYLTVLLVDRAFRHDKRCKDKYGSAWDTYCNKVPYKIIPYIY
jgi:7-dehydrocholesterol reductase